MKNLGAAPSEELATGERSTRNRVARSILDHGPSTVADLAERLGLTQAAVRRHLDALVGEQVVEAREKRVYGARTRGRPAKVFALTDCGRDAFDQSYDSLAVEALRWIALFRLALPDVILRYAGGREVTLRELQALGMTAGINALIVGNYLTTLGRSPDEDLQMLEDLRMPIGALSKAI